MVEVLGVVTILVVISLFTFPMISSLMSSSNTNRNKQFLTSLYQATEAYIERDYDRYSKNEISYIGVKTLIEEGLLQTNFTNPDTKQKLIDEDGIVEVRRNIDNSFSYNYVINQYITINYVEDLISILNSSDTYENKVIVLNRNLDFKDNNSYKNINTPYNGSTIKLALVNGGLIKKSTVFKGKISGNGYSINNIYIENENLGLFNNMNNAVIENINLSGIIDGKNGGLLAVTIENTNINNVNIDVQIPYSSALSETAIGGIAATSLGSTIKNSTVTTDVNKSQGFSVGGLFELTSNTIIENCHQKGTIIAKEVGGIVNRLNSSSKIINSSSEGKLIGSDSSAGIANYVNLSQVINSSSKSSISSSNSGGISNHVDNDSLIKSCHYIGDINGSIVGGIAASLNSSTIEKSYSAVNMQANKDSVSGGLVGNSTSSTIKNSYSLSNIKSNEAIINCGGLVGLSSSTTIQNSYFSGSLSEIVSTNSSYIGGIIGSSTTSTIISSYFNSSLFSGNAFGNSIGDTTTNVSNLTNDDMLLSSSYVGWDFTNTWNINGKSFPSLR